MHSSSCASRLHGGGNRCHRAFQHGCMLSRRSPLPAVGFAIGQPGLIASLPSTVGSLVVRAIDARRDRSIRPWGWSRPAIARAQPMKPVRAWKRTDDRHDPRTLHGQPVGFQPALIAADRTHGCCERYSSPAPRVWRASSIQSTDEPTVDRGHECHTACIEANHTLLDRVRLRSGAVRCLEAERFLDRSARPSSQR
jgi:hypothetical protein